MSSRKQYADTLCRWVLALAYAVFGLNGFVTFIPVPELHPFMEILVASGYIYAVKLVEVVGAILLMRRRTVVIGLMLLTPVTVNICLYHALLDPRNWGVAVVLAVANLVLLANRFDWFRTALRRQELPEEAEAPSMLA